MFSLALSLILFKLVILIFAQAVLNAAGSVLYAFSIRLYIISTLLSTTKGFSFKTAVVTTLILLAK